MENYIVENTKNSVFFFENPAYVRLQRANDFG